MNQKGTGRLAGTRRVLVLGGTGTIGRAIYSSLAIETTLALRLVFGLALRQTEGFVASFLRLMDLDLPVRDQTTLSRRGPGLELVERKVPKTGALDIIVDSTGPKIIGPGEWLAERHGGSKRREWRKLHLGLDPKSGDLVARDLTPRHVADVTALPGLFNQVDGRIETFLAGQSYDRMPTYRLVSNVRTPSMAMDHGKTDRVRRLPCRTGFSVLTMVEDDPARA